MGEGREGDHATLVLALMQDPSQRLAYRQRMASGALKGLDPVTSSLFFGTPITLQELMFNEVLPGATPGAVHGLDAANTKAGAPRQFNPGVQAVNAKEQEANESNQILAMMGMSREIADNTKTAAGLLALINTKLEQRGAKTDIKGEFFRALGTRGNTITTNGILNADNISSFR